MKIRKLEKNVNIILLLSENNKNSDLYNYIFYLHKEYKNLINNLNVSLNNKFLRRDMRKMLQTRKINEIIEVILTKSTDQLIINTIQLLKVDLENLETDLNK